MIIGQVFAGAAYGLATHQRHVMVGHTLAAFHLARKQDGACIRNGLKICLVLLVSTKTKERQKRNTASLIN